MDAVMVVHQLQRLASAPDPSPAVISKLPRMVIGLSFFIDHPEIGVRQQAAKAVLIVCKQHASLLRDTPEGRELLSTLTRHAESSAEGADPVVLDSCKDAIRALEDAANVRDKKREDEGGENKEGEENKEGSQCPSPASHQDCGSPGNATHVDKQKHGSSSEGKREDNEDHVEKKTHGDREEDESMRNSGERGRGCSPSSSSFNRSGSVVEGVMYTVLLGLRGLIVDLRRLRKEQEEKERKKHPNSFHEKLPTTTGACSSSALLSSFSSSCLSKESRAKALLDELQKQLQYRLVCVPGVSSATITLNIRSLARQLEKEEEEKWTSQKEKKNKDKESDESNEDKKTHGVGGDKDAHCDGQPDENNKEERHEEEEEQGKKDNKKKKDEERRKEEDEKDEEEGDGVAVLLMRLSSLPEQRLLQLQQVKESAGPLTLVLRAERIYSAKESHRDSRSESSRNNSSKHHRSRVKSSHNSEMKSTKHGDSSASSRSKYEERRGRRGGEGREERTAPSPSCSLDKPSRHDGDAGEEEDLSLHTSRRSSHPEADFKDHHPNLHPNDISSSLACMSSTQASSPAYLDEETIGGEQDEAEGETGETGMYGGCRSGEGLHGTGETAAGYSFFSRNSVLFTQSRFLGSSILPYEDQPELAARLKREKEKKAEERMRQLQSQNTLDRVLGSIGKVRFW